MPAKNLEDLRKIVARLVNFNVDEPDEGFDGNITNPWQTIDDAINEACIDEFNFGRSHVSLKHLLTDDVIVWGASENYLVLPDYLQNNDIWSVWDITNASSGNPAGNLLWISSISQHYVPTVSWLTPNKLMWSGTPGSDKSLRFIYVNRPIELVNKIDEPTWMPIEHRHLLGWSAACLLRTIADDEAPGAWIARRQELRDDWVLAHSTAKPRVTNFSQISEFWEGDSWYGI